MRTPKKNDAIRVRGPEAVEGWTQRDARAIIKNKRSNILFFTNNDATFQRRTKLHHLIIRRYNWSLSRKRIVIIIFQNQRNIKPNLKNPNLGKPEAVHIGASPP